MRLRRRVRAPILLPLLIAAIHLAGCSGPTLAPTPNLFLLTDENPFSDVAPVHRTREVRMLYATDRAREEKEGAPPKYGYGRSASLAFGTATVSLGREDMTWEALVEASRARPRRREVPLELTEIDEIVRFPLSYAPFEYVDGIPVDDPSTVAAREETGTIARAVLSEHLALAERKELFIFVHGYNNDFAVAAHRMAQLWHFIGREGVPLLYTWPAGRPGALRGYNYDRESGEFTIYHLKQLLTGLAGCEDVERIHLVGHSRGTDVVMSALRELNIRFKAQGKSTRKGLKLGNLILAAPDLDWEVVGQRISAEHIAPVPERFTIYLSEDDRAIGIASWLYSSGRRVGQLRESDLPPERRRTLKSLENLQVINVKAKLDWMGHGYFISNPAVLSDLILVLRDDRDAGAGNGRPLERRESGFWELNDDYPAGVGLDVPAR